MIEQIYFNVFHLFYHILKMLFYYYTNYVKLQDTNITKL